ncbi:MAG TPA: glycosyltransferase family 4 protein, partial [Ignavibacteriaceae bacterium]|nr:glycosyltransferase family 4 protein [Ignavibacteriaceae bacterium]
AALFFSKKIFPLIIEKIPNAKFYVVGQNPPLKIRRLSSGNIKVMGFVPDIRNEYLKSAVNVAPIRFSAGTLNKIIESLALGIPVVATSIAVEGLPKELLKYIYVADSPEFFAEKVIEILNHPDVRNNLMHEGIKAVRNLLDWEKIVRDFQTYLENELYNLKQT